jgi:thioredoxin-like negative regulator of GroEL
VNKSRALVLIGAFITCLLLGAGLAYGNFISEITEMTFKTEVMDSETPVIVWFCYESSMIMRDPLGDAIDKVARKIIQRVKILKMDSKYNIISVEKFKIVKNNTFVLFVDGKEKSRTNEIRSEKDMTLFIEKNLPAPPEQPK